MRDGRFTHREMMKVTFHSRNKERLQSLHIVKLSLTAQTSGCEAHKVGNNCLVHALIIFHFLSLKQLCWSGICYSYTDKCSIWNQDFYSLVFQG